MFAKVNSMGIFGMEVFPVSVEADISSGLPRFDVVGLPDSAKLCPFCDKEQRL